MCTRVTHVTCFVMSLQHQQQQAGLARSFVAQCTLNHDDLQHKRKHVASGREGIVSKFLAMRQELEACERATLASFDKEVACLDKQLHVHASACEVLAQQVLGMLVSRTIENMGAITAIQAQMQTETVKLMSTSVGCAIMDEDVKQFIRQCAVITSASVDQLVDLDCELEWKLSKTISSMSSNVSKTQLSRLKAVAKHSWGVTFSFLDTSVLPASLFKKDVEFAINHDNSLFAVRYQTGSKIAIVTETFRAGNCFQRYLCDLSWAFNSDPVHLGQICFDGSGKHVIVADGRGLVEVNAFSGNIVRIITCDQREHGKFWTVAANSEVIVSSADVPGGGQSVFVFDGFTGNLLRTIPITPVTTGAVCKYLSLAPNGRALGMSFHPDGFIQVVSLSDGKSVANPMGPLKNASKLCFTNDRFVAAVQDNELVLFRLFDGASIIAVSANFSGCVSVSKPLARDIVCLLNRSGEITSYN